MATLSSLRHDPRLKAHYERLTQRVTRPLPPMQAIGACMTKLLHDAFAVVKNRTAFDADQRWTTEFGQLAKVGSRPRRRSLECHGSDGVILLS